MSRFTRLDAARYVTDTPDFSRYPRDSGKCLVGGKTVSDRIAGRLGNKPGIVCLNSGTKSKGHSSVCQKAR